MAVHSLWHCHQIEAILSTISSFIDNNWICRQYIDKKSPESTPSNTPQLSIKQIPRHPLLARDFVLNCPYNTAIVTQSLYGVRK